MDRTVCNHRYMTYVLEVLL